MDYPLLTSLKLPQDLKKLPAKQYKKLAEEVRDFISDAVKKNGGHLGPNLGVVDIVLGCHVAFDLSKDRLVFDVGHQAYPHKVLTGRIKEFSTLRKKNGMSGYPSQKESIYDVYRSGHASTAISTALGIRCGFDQSPELHDRHVIALVGDGSMTGGMAFEGLNHAGHLKKNLIVILNDNSMSISPTVGGLAKTFSDFRHLEFYTHVREGVVSNIKKIPKLGQKLEAIVNYTLEEATRIVTPGQIFTVLGFDYIGPIDGNNAKEVIQALNKAKKVKDRPVLIHALTKKGLGFKPNGPDGEVTVGPHALSPPSSALVKANTVAKKPIAKMPSYSATAVAAVMEVAKKDKKVIAITAAMADGTGLSKFQEQYPDRYFDVGICEAHAVGLSAGISTVGLKPFFAVYSTFFQRGFDQVFHDVVLQGNVPVVFGIDRAGVVGDDGPSHHGSYDIAYLRIFPHMVIMAPKDGKELNAMLKFAFGLNRTTAVRYPRTSIPTDDYYKCYQKAATPVRLGKSEILKLGKSKVCLYAYGSMVQVAAQAEQELAREGIDVSLVNARFAKPIDVNILKKICISHTHLVVLEEGTIRGGLGSAVLEEISVLSNDKANAKIADTKIMLCGLPDKLVEHATRDEQFKMCKIDYRSIIKLVKELVPVKVKKVKKTVRKSTQAKRR